jgi:hypothetical protein
MKSKFRIKSCYVSHTVEIRYKIERRCFLVIWMSYTDGVLSRDVAEQTLKRLQKDEVEGVT